MHCDRLTKESTLKLSISDSAHLINHGHWESIVGDRNVYLTIPYLTALEASLSNDIHFKYILFYDHGFEPVGVAVVQLLHFTNKELNVKDLESRFGSIISEHLLNKIDARVMLCGNAFCTGENGFLFCETVASDIAHLNLSHALTRIKRHERKANNGVNVIMLKDFWPSSFNDIQVFSEDEGFSEFMIDVNMVINVKENWTSFEAYMDDMITKFRTKIKGIYKKSSSVEARILTHEQIREESEAIDRLYHNVLDRSDYRFGELTPKSFEYFARNVSEHFRFMGYYKDDKMVGFSTCFWFNDLIDANFVGIDYELNHDYAIYQRMLCDFVQTAIECKAKTIHLGRTAEEIKSCLGAEPVNMKLLVKHRNAITNKLVKPIVSHISPSKFELRRPFKAVLYQN